MRRTFLIDAAKAYKNEDSIGKGVARAIKEGIVKREELFIITKIWPTDYSRPEEVCKEQLKDLQVDYVDSYLIHWPWRIYDLEKKEHQKIPLYKLYAKLEALLDKGLIKSIGLANFNVQSTMDVLTYCIHKPVINQIEINPYFPQKELVKYCQSQGLAVIAYNSLVQGNWYSKNVKDFHKYDLFNEKIVTELAKKYQKSSAQICLNWAICRNIAVIPKSSSLTRIKENLESSSFRLSKEDFETLEEINYGVRFNSKEKYEFFGYFDVYA
mmetsp:Transcript_10516/g.10884  ORF Transcript_10516/g.10884 Transcript_10516/m.10884 type:complete len:269 (-) Transcript_10516:59-865(-)